MRKQLRFTSFLIVLLGMSFSAQAVNLSLLLEETIAESEALSALQATEDLSVADFLTMSPKDFKEATGQKLGIKGTLALKAAQKKIKKQAKAGNKSADISEGLYIVLVILGWGWLVMGILDEFSGNNWWVNLLLTALCWLPGVIHGLSKKSDYY